MRFLKYEPKPAPLLNQNDTVSPERKSNWFSQLTFGWMFSLLKIGYSRPLEVTDLWRLEDDRLSRSLSDLLEHNFYELYAHVDAAFQDTRTAEEVCSNPPSADSHEKMSTEKETNSQELETGRNAEINGSDALQPMTSRVDLPGISEPNPKHASIREAEKTFVPSVERWKWFFPILKKKGAIEFESVEQYDKAATRAHSMRLFYAIFRTVRTDIILAFIARLVSRATQITMSIVVKELIRFVTESHRWHEASESERLNMRRPRHVGVGFGLAIGLAAMQQATFLLNGFYGHRSIMAGSYLRIAVIDQIARKSMRLSTRARVKQTPGRLTTAVSGDAAFLDSGTYCIIDVIVEPIAILAGCALLIYNLRYSALVGVGVLFASSPILTAMMNQLITSRQTQMKFIDKRLRLLSEIFKAIRQIKLYAYEAFFGERIIQVREQELGALKRNVWNRSLVIATMTFLPILAAVLTFITYGLSGNRLEAAVIFAAFQLFNVIQTPLQNLPASFANLTDAWVALGRVSDIFLAEEYPRDIVSNPQSKCAVRIHGNFSYESAEPPSDSSKTETVGKDRKAEKAEKKRKAIAKRAAKSRAKRGLPPVATNAETPQELTRAPFALVDIDVTIPRGALVCVIGRIGSGKSALLQAIIGELRQISGEIELGGTLSYVAQQAWIQNATLQDNITLGHAHFDEDKLRRAISTCALTKDLQQLQDGLATEIGERGINLSGGQKARIALARAVYHDADIALLDSPLAAVDSHVSASLIENCILGDDAFGTKSRVLITHHLEVLPRADLVLVLEEGRIVQQGTYAELLRQPGVMQSLIAEYGNGDDHEDEPTNGTGMALEVENPQKLEEGKVLNANSNGKLIMDEERNTGSVTWAIYLAYARVMSREWWMTISVIALILGQASSVLNVLFLGYWSGQTIPGFRQGDYMALYATFGGVNALCILGASFSMFIAGIRASFIMFDSALTSVLRSPISFHDATPVGRIIHRLTKDVEKLDDRLTYQWYFVLVNFTAVLGTIFLVFFIYPYLGIIFLPLIIIYVAIGKFFSRSSREAKRLDSLLRSFTYSAFGEQLSGISTIRAFGLQQHFLHKLQETLDRQIRSEYVILAGRRWLVLRLDSLGTVLVLGIGLFGVGLRNQVDPVKLGVVLTYAIRTVLVFGLMVHYAVQVEQEMNTAERVLHYIDLEHEAAARLPTDPPSDWPRHGHVVFKDVQMRYRPDLPLVLKGLTFEAQPEEKVGIVGRTGAGKSSLAQALFRIVELAAGRIEIDGVDLRTIGLDTLRSQLSALPQDTLLFSGTMRENLDPTGIKTDHELNDVLRRCGLDPTAEQVQVGSDIERYKKFQLDSIVGDDGDNFSGGERQLVALCRALVKNSHVLLLDEATSSVDPETDAVIQDCIRKEFTSTTLLCIAHRLATIAFYDKVLVMDAGQIAEFDHPLVLFDKPDSIFRSMCDAAKLSREAIFRIRAGENVSVVEREVEEGEQPEGDSIKPQDAKIEPTRDELAVDEADETQEAIATVPTGDQGATRSKD